jgi:hypothetical protein
MPSDIRPITVVIFALSAAACSGTPRSAEPAAGTAAQPKPAPQTPADVDLSLVKAGYSVRRLHGEVFYCRTEVITGNRIASQVCLTAAQIQGEKQDVIKARDILDHGNNRCVAGSCND